jgi:prevent-host-death family protein
VQVNIHEAKTHVSRLLERVEQGEEVIIMGANVPVAKLTRATPSVARRELGWAKCDFTVPDNFDDPLPPEIEGSFYGE